MEQTMNPEEMEEILKLVLMAKYMRMYGNAFMPRMGLPMNDMAGYGAGFPLAPSNYMNPVPKVEQPKDGSYVQPDRGYALVNPTFVVQYNFNGISPQEVYRVLNKGSLQKEPDKDTQAAMQQWYGRPMFGEDGKFSDQYLHVGEPAETGSSRQYGDTPRIYVTTGYKPETKGKQAAKSYSGSGIG